MLYQSLTRVPVGREGDTRELLIERTGFLGIAALAPSMHAGELQRWSPRGAGKKRTRPFAVGHLSESADIILPV